MKRITLALVCAAFLLGVTEAAEKSSSPCDQPEVTQFDFWVGEWYVFSNDKLVGRNEIKRILGGCTLIEKYTAAGGKFAGRSFSYFEPEDGRWHQVWVDDSGTRMHLTGGYADGRMVMSGDRLKNGETVTDRISWTDNSDGTVRQLWELSEDGGKSWQALFDGQYRPVQDKASGGGK